MSNVEPTCSLTHFLPVYTQHPGFPEGYLAFCKTLNYSQLNNDYGKTEEHTFLIFCGFELEPNFPKQGLLSNPESIMFTVLYYSTHSAAPWWQLWPHHHDNYHHHHHNTNHQCYSHVFVMRLFVSLWGKGGVLRGGCGDTWEACSQALGPC